MGSSGDHGEARVCYPYASQAGFSCFPEGPSMKIKFTREAIAALRLPDGKADETWWDDVMPRFGYRLRESGNASWVVQYRNADGITRKMRLDGTVGLAAARKWARKRLGQAEGGDPQAERQEARANARLTFGKVVQQYLDIRDPSKKLYVTRRH